MSACLEQEKLECAFGILYSKWCVISKAVETEVELADKIVKCICVLHNTIIEKRGLKDISLMLRFKVNL